MLSIVEFILCFIGLSADLTSIWVIIGPLLPTQVVSLITTINSWIFSLYGMVILTIIILLILWKKFLKASPLEIQYRFASDPFVIDLPSSDLKQETGAIIKIYIKGKITDTTCLRILRMFHCSFLLSFECPDAVIMNTERQYSEWKVLVEEPQLLILSGNIKTSGIREIELAFSREEMASFEGHDQIPIKIFFAPKMRVLRQAFQFINGTIIENKIDIA